MNNKQLLTTLEKHHTIKSKTRLLGFSAALLGYHHQLDLRVTLAYAHLTVRDYTTKIHQTESLRFAYIHTNKICKNKNPKKEKKRKEMEIKL